MQHSDKKSMNWELCCICQTKDTDVLICPALNNDAANVGTGYRTLAENLSSFKNIGALPDGVLVFKNLEQGKSLDELLLSKKAKYHKKCSVRYNKSMLNRALKRSASFCTSNVEAQTDMTPKEKRPRPSRLRCTSEKENANVCFICNQQGPVRSNLYNIASLQDAKLKKCAEVSNNIELSAFLEGGDLVAKEAKYHAKCYTNLTNTLRSPQQMQGDETTLCNSLAFSSVASYIRETLGANRKAIIKMSHLKNLYAESLNHILGLRNAELSDVHSTRLKDRILTHFPYLKAQLSGREYVYFIDGVDIFNQISFNNLDDDAVACERVLKHIRNDIRKSTIAFDGQLQSSRHGVPPTLLAAVNFLLYGRSSVDHESNATQPAISISQMIIFNYCETMPKGGAVRHNKDREPPLPIYIALSLHGQARSKTLIENLHERGICISSNRVREIISAFGQIEVERALTEGVVCPPNFLHGLFVIGAYDNIDHNFSSNTSQETFHGTAISIFQVPAVGDIGTPRSYVPHLSTVNQTQRRIPDLPESFSIVKAFALRKKNPETSKVDGDIFTAVSPTQFYRTWKHEENWLNRVHSGEEERNGLAPLDFSWAGFHASKVDLAAIQQGRGSLLPLFSQSSSCPAMIKHGMEQIQRITSFLNPGQIPVICVDQPLYALAKTIQWNWSDSLGESKFVVMMGPFHIEQAFLKLLGKILSDSGWISIVANSGLKTETGAELCLKVNHVKKSRTMHEKTAATLYGLLRDAFSSEAPETSFDDWIGSKSTACPTFKFWLLVLNLEILLLTFVRSLRNGDYELFIQSLKALAPWFFVMDHTNYARWLPIFIKDLIEIENLTPSVHNYFKNGQFVVKKSLNPFSAMAVDQAHEQNNAVIKGGGGAIGLMHDSQMLRKWVLSGPQLMNSLECFESSATHTPSRKSLHHEQYAAFQKKFRHDVTALKNSFLQFGNPFLENSPDLVTWDTKVVMDKDLVCALNNVEKTAFRLYNEYTIERLVKGSKLSIFDPIPKNKIQFFGHAPKKSLTPLISDLKNDVELFSRAFIVSKNRDLNLDTFFQYENASAPPSLSSNGVLRPGQKSQLLKILTGDVFDLYDGFCDAVIYDGAALVHAVPPISSKNFEDYCKFEFTRRITNDIEKFKPIRIHFSWDSYAENSLKKFVRVQRGSGLRRKVRGNNPLPKNWQEFLKCDENKIELFRLLGNYLLQNLSSSIHVVTEIDGVIHSSHEDESSIHGMNCRIEEEADGRIFLHAKDSIEHKAKTVLIYTIDTDVVVLAVSLFEDFRKAGLEQMWTLFGTGAQQRHININALFENLGKEQSSALRGFHAFTGCDLTSSFAFKGKISAWKTWKEFPDATHAFLELSQPYESLSDSVLNILERFTCLMYSNSATNMDVNLLRKCLFATRNRSLQHLPPTREALRQHCLRAAYQAGQVWGRACLPLTEIPEPENWGWKKIDGGWTPLWSSFPCIWDACRELVKCSCTTGCSKRCSCLKAKVPCTLLCANCTTGDQCSNKYNERNNLEHETEDIF